MVFFARSAEKGETPEMEIHGLQKLTLLDYPGHTACTVFTARCNWRCPFCHNASLVLRPGEQPVLSEEEFFAFLRRRRGLLDGVAVTGGEPTLNRDLPDFLRKIKEEGFLVKLDTNGTHPDMLRGILSEGLADYVAMDIKAGRSNYSAVTGTLRPGLDAVSRSVEILKSCDTEHEFRTTVVRELHSDIDFEDIADWLAGEKRYFLQEFKDSGDLVSDGCSACGAEEMDRFLSIVRRTIPGAAIRGMD